MGFDGYAFEKAGKIWYATLTDSRIKAVGETATFKQWADVTVDQANTLKYRVVDVNAHGGAYGNALQAASARGHNKIIEVLLSKDANVNAQGGLYGNALQAASAEGYDKIVEVLPSNGAVQELGN
ncbi:hypothetical protein V491_09060 [Pseudogymnoascus sp. VKM F-3775]|nr:hypothetical protein V491_09060 [Pseudogymnoascus sp. VKM F-3775]